jgi:hypothetical protein
MFPSTCSKRGASPHVKNLNDDLRRPPRPRLPIGIIEVALGGAVVRVQLRALFEGLHWKRVQSRRVARPQVAQ